jgi:hypothetical protein
MSGRKYYFNVLKRTWEREGGGEREREITERKWRGGRVGERG